MIHAVADGKDVYREGSAEGGGGQPRAGDANVVKAVFAAAWGAPSGAAAKKSGGGNKVKSKKERMKAMSWHVLCC